MKQGVHPQFFDQCKVTCACGNSFKVGATKEAIRVDICSACHPFFTGEQRIVDTAGQVERFMKRLEKAEKSSEAPKNPAPEEGKEAKG